MAAPMSDEELYQLTGSWEAAAAMRDQQAQAASQDNTQTAVANTSAAGIAALPNNLTNSYIKNFAGQDYTLDNSSVDKLAAQILAQNTSSKWTGEGWGSAQANARAMAENLAASGITDINQVGKKSVVIPGYDQYTGGDAQNLEHVDDQTVQQFINKTTGQQLINDFAERGGTGNTFSGTYTGKGNTAYNVQFDAKGNPVFYTTGGSSNDLVNMFKDDPLLGAVAQAAAGYFGGPAATAALNLAMGKDLKDVAKSTLLSYLGNEAFKGITDVGVDTNTFGETGANFAKDIKDTFGDTGSKILGKTAGQFVANEGKVDIGNLLVSQGIGAATNAVLDQIPDFKTLDPIIQKLVTKTVSNTLSGSPGLTTAQIVSTALNEGLKASKGGGSLSAEEQAQVEANRETKRLNRIEDAVLNQPASDDGTTQGILDLINEMYPAANVKGMSQGDLSKFLEANINDIQGSAELETLLKGAGQTTADEGTVTVTGNRPTGLGDFMVPTSNVADKGEMVITGNKNGTSLDDFIGLNDIVGDTTNNYVDDGTVLVTGKTDKDDDVPELVVDDKKDNKCAPGFHDDGTGLCVADDDVKEDGCPEGYILDLATNQCVKLDDTKVTVPPKKVVTPKVDTTKKTKKSEDLMDSLGLNRQAPSQDPYANIKSMEDLFGGDIAYKLRALGVNPSQKLASSDMDELVRLLRG